MEVKAKNVSGGDDINIVSDNMELIAQKLQKVSKALNGTLETELADKLLQ